MMEVYTSVMRSNNYDMFKFMEGNRKINSSNLNQIIVSMREKQLIIPITVNEKFEIIDGQHIMGNNNRKNKK
jgi:ParB-like chromosome segregation protein Spo0J